MTKLQRIDQKTLMSDLFQRNLAEKEIVLLEIQMLKQQAKSAGNLAFMGQEEKDHWNKLLDSNIRAGTMACMWCMKAQLVKKTSLAFHKWKFAIAKATWGRSLSPGKLDNSSNRLHNSGTLSSNEKPMSAVLAKAISLVNHLKENEVESNLNTRLFMSPSASVNAANEAATSALQFDMNNLGNPAESLEAYNKQRLAYVLRSLHEHDTKQGDSSATATTATRPYSLNLDGTRRNSEEPGLNLSTEEGLDAYLRSALLSNDADSETKRQILLALSHTVASRPQSNNLPLRDPQVATRSSLSLLKGVPASKPATGTSNLSYSTGNPPGRGRANSRSLSPNARMHSRPRVANSYDDNYEQNNNYQSRSHNYGHNAMLTPDAESVHFFSASDVEPESVPSSRGTSIYLDGRPHRDSHSSRGGQGQGQAQVHTQSRRDGGYHATDYNVSAVSSRGGGGGGYNGEDAADYSYSGYNVPTRTYPPANYNAQGSATLMPSGARSESTGGGRRGQHQHQPPQQQVPRYLMPTNSYRKKRNSLPESARSFGKNYNNSHSASSRRSRSPTMITNSNSKHAVNVLGGGRGNSRNSHSPTVAYTVKEAIAQSRSRSTTPNGTLRSSSQQQPLGAQALSYGDLTFADYQQRKLADSASRKSSLNTPNATSAGTDRTASSGHYNQHHNQHLHQHGQHTGPPVTSESFLDSVTQGIANYYSSSPPPPPPPGSSSFSSSAIGAAGRGGGPAIHLPLPPVPLALPDASFFMQPSGPPSSSVSAAPSAPAPTAAAPEPEQVYQQYDAYHSSTLRTNSVDMNDAHYGEHSHSNGSGDVLMDEDVILHSGFQHAPVRGDINHSQPAPVLPYVAHQQHMLQNGASDTAQAAPVQQVRRKSRSSGGGGQQSGGSKEKSRGMDKAQLALMMHGDVYDRPATWHQSLRN